MPKIARTTTGGRKERLNTGPTASASSSNTENQAYQQNLSDTARSERGRKQKSSSAGTTTQLQEATSSINQLTPEEVEATRAESSQSIITGPKRKQTTTE